MHTKPTIAGTVFSPSAPFPLLPRLSQPLRWGVLLLLAFLAVNPDAIAQKTTKTTSKKSVKAPTKAQQTKASNEVQQKKESLQGLRGQIDALRKTVSKNEDKHANITNRVKELERDISTKQRELRILGTERSKAQETVKRLSTQSTAIEKNLVLQRAQMERLIYQQYIQGNPDPLQFFLSGRDFSQVARDRVYLSAIGRARQTLQLEIEDALRQKQTLAAEMSERAKELVAIERKQKEDHQKFLAQREQRKQLLQQLSADISKQRREIGNLQKNEKQLSQLITQLSKVIAAKPKPKPVSNANRLEKQPVELDNDKTPEASSAGQFSALKGRLRLPVKGTITNRFGRAREEGGTWKGLFVRSAQGADIKSIAAGKVVFADWMRGFGNLLIIDHGGSYLSIYGNNESLLKQLGASVASGDVIASVGSSGGNPESGLYFELRHQGQPIDPMAWIKLN